ncbi:hypothetical protein KKA14_12155 [bacterium]|nr:hypothetical protein [bacterium]
MSQIREARIDVFAILRYPSCTRKLKTAKGFNEIPAFAGMTVSPDEFFLCFTAMLIQKNLDMLFEE